MEQNNKKCYYLTVFSLEGHGTFRAHLSMNPQGFEVEQKNWSEKTPKIQSKKVYAVDKLTGEITSLDHE